MPGWIDTPEEEKAWKKAKRKVAEQRNKTEDEFTDRDWGLVTHITKNILKSTLDHEKGINFALTKVEKLLEARVEKKRVDASLPEESQVIVGALQAMANVSGQSISKLRKGADPGLEIDEARALARELQATAAKLKKLLEG